VAHDSVERVGDWIAIINPSGVGKNVTQKFPDALNVRRKQASAPVFRALLPPPGPTAIELSIGTPNVGRPLLARNERGRVAERGNPIKTRLLSPALSSSSVGREGEERGRFP
jgi:hypothetical protein